MTDIRPQMDGMSPSAKIASIIRGRIQSEGDVSRAKSNPLAESLIPAQLICSQGRKKQSRMNPAVPRVTCRAFFTKRVLALTPPASNLAAPDLVMRLKSGHWMDAPWAVVLAPADFGKFSNDILVGNLGSGRIAAFDPKHGNFHGFLRGSHGLPIAIEGLWGLSFGNGGTAG